MERYIYTTHAWTFIHRCVFLTWPISFCVSVMLVWLDRITHGSPQWPRRCLLPPLGEGGRHHCKDPCKRWRDSSTLSYIMYIHNIRCYVCKYPFAHTIHPFLHHPRPLPTVSIEFSRAPIAVSISSCRLLSMGVYVCMQARLGSSKYVCRCSIFALPDCFILTQSKLSLQLYIRSYTLLDLVNADDMLFLEWWNTFAGMRLLDRTHASMWDDASFFYCGFGSFFSQEFIGWLHSCWCQGGRFVFWVGDGRADAWPASYP